MSDDDDNNTPLILFTLILFLFVGSIAKQLAPKYFTITLLLVGMSSGVLLNFTSLKESQLGGVVLGLSRIDPHTMLYVFLPPLIFESAFSIEWHLFKKTAWQCLLLAGPGLLLASGMTALPIKVVMYEDWTFAASLLLGTVLSATDPVAVVALLKELGAKKSLATLIEGESLMNDGTAMVIFNVVFPALKLARYVPGGQNTEYSPWAPDAFSVIAEFAKMALGGALWGLFCGILMAAWHNACFNRPLVEIAISFAAAFATFFVAEFYLGVSGVLGVGAYGVYMGCVGRTSISPEARSGTAAMPFSARLPFLFTTRV